MALLERFYDSTSDDSVIYVDKQNHREVNVQLLRAQIGLVNQEPSLFSCSIRDNIAYGKPDATQAEIEEAAKAAFIHDVIMSFPQQYDTKVGSKGSQLSGG